MRMSIKNHVLRIVGLAACSSGSMAYGACGAADVDFATEQARQAFVDLDSEAVSAHAQEGLTQLRCTAEPLTQVQISRLATALGVAQWLTEDAPHPWMCAARSLAGEGALSAWVDPGHPLDIALREADCGEPQTVPTSRSDLLVDGVPAARSQGIPRDRPTIMQQRLDDGWQTTVLLPSEPIPTWAMPIEDTGGSKRGAGGIAVAGGGLAVAGVGVALVTSSHAARKTWQPVLSELEQADYRRKLNGRVALGAVLIGVGLTGAGVGGVTLVSTGQTVGLRVIR
jgi:hypothetical protein